jgi:hypothetical protein
VGWPPVIIALSATFGLLAFGLAVLSLHLV